MRRQVAGNVRHPISELKNRGLKPAGYSGVCIGNSGSLAVIANAEAQKGIIAPFCATLIGNPHGHYAMTVL